VARGANDNPQRANTIGGFGHYEDELAKVNGQWFFTKRKIYNDGSAKWQYKGGRESCLVERFFGLGGQTCVE